MVATSASAAIAALKNTPAPKFLRVKEYDSENLVQVAVPEVKRWKGKVCKIVDTLNWAWLEPLDQKGNILGPRIDNPEAGRATDLEDLEEDVVGENAGKGLASLTGLLSLLLKAQDTALVRQRQAYSDVLDNNQKLLSVISDRLGKMEKHAHQSFEVITALHNRLNLETLKGEDGDEEGLDGIVKDVLLEVVQGKLKSPASTGPTD